MKVDEKNDTQETVQQRLIHKMGNVTQKEKERDREREKERDRESASKPGMGICLSSFTHNDIHPAMISLRRAKH